MIDDLPYCSAVLVTFLFPDVEGRKLVAFAKWKYPYILTPEEQAEKDKLDLGRNYPPGTNEKLYEQFFGRLDALRKKYLDEESDYCKYFSRSPSPLFFRPPNRVFEPSHIAIIYSLPSHKQLTIVLS